MNDETKTTEQAPAAAESAPKKAKAKKAPAKKAPAKKAVKKAKAKKATDGVTGPAILAQYAKEYHRDTEKKTAGGNVSVDNDDPIANKLRGKPLDDVYAIAAKALDVTEKELRAKYKHLNVGMQRMNLGNRMRAV